jgi:hypothetical protein
MYLLLVHGSASPSIYPAENAVTSQSTAVVLSWNNQLGFGRVFAIGGLIALGSSPSPGVQQAC